MKQKTFAKLLSLFALVALSTACSPGFQAMPQDSGTGAGGTAGIAAATPLAISPSVQSVAPNAMIQFQVTGGAMPYKFSIATGEGDIDSDTGLFLAAATEGSVQVLVTDAAGTKASSSVMVAIAAASDPGAILVTSWSPTSVQPGSTVTLSVSGGTSPYTFELIQGTGTLSGTQYTASATNESVVIKVTDSKSNSARIAFDVGSASSSTIPGISVASINLYYPGSTTAQCGGNGTFAGQVAWMAAKHYHYRGEVQVCATAQATSSAATIVSDLVLSGDHNLSTSSCPTGFTNIGDIVDCRGGYCRGTQTFCAQLSSPSSASSFITDLYLTPEGKGAASGSNLCSSGYAVAGEVGDCGGGICSGVQQICVRKQ
jgi:hypothetical protein